MVLYQGPSQIDGKQIKVKVVGKSRNAKTGGMVQTHILRADIEPHKALKTGDDESVCGQCPLRPALGGGCYVLTFQGPLSTYRSEKDNTQAVSKALAKGQGLRLGSYGDPTAVPVEKWAALLEQADYHTGYTHQWREPYAQAYKGILQASCNSMQDVIEAKAMGWKVFATWKGINGQQFREAGLLATRCPSDPGLDSKRTCEECRLCDGKRADIWIAPHGTHKNKVK